MTRLAIALVFALGCSGNKGATTPSGNGSDGPAQLVKRISISWGIQQSGDGADLYLAVADETGKVVSHELGRWKGICSKVMPPPDMNALIALDCRTGGTGTELQAITHGGDEIVVVKLGIDQGVTPDPMAREEVKRIKVPLGVAIEAAP